MHIENYSLENMCEVLDISKRTYYKYRAAEDKDYYDYLLIKEIFDESKGTYGYRRICEGLLIKYGVIFNHKKTARIMKKYGLKPEYIKRIRPNITCQRIEKNVKPNLLNRNFNIDEPNRVWVTDITYLIFGNKRAYLSTILDLYDRKIVAYQISKRNDIKLVIDTLNQAIAKTKDVSSLIIHSDQDFQYTSFEYKAVCESNGIQISMSRKGTPIDDSPIESFHSILKKETLYNNYITSFDEYLLLVEDWLIFLQYFKAKKQEEMSSLPAFVVVFYSCELNRVRFICGGIFIYCIYFI